MELRQLSYFICVAQMKNISRAAARLNVAQPALSRQIRKLEAELGVSLLRRETRGVELTDDGVTLLEQATELIARSHQLVESFNAKGRIIEENLTVALPDWIGRVLIAPVLEQFKAKYPRGALHVKVGLSGSIKEWVLNGGADIGLLPNADFLDHGMLDLKLLFREPLLLIGPKRKDVSKVLQGNRLLKFEDLMTIPLILAGPEHGLRRVVDHAARVHNVKLKAILEVDNFAILRSLVLEGRGYTLLASSGVQDDVKQGLIDAWRIDAVECQVGLWLARLKTNRMSRPLEIFVRLLQQQLERSGYALTPEDSIIPETGEVLKP
jgi:LysR family nitrogen assimilation transcriptional regulator